MAYKSIKNWPEDGRPMERLLKLGSENIPEFVHNHPSGDPTTSSKDISVTERLVKTGDIIGIKVLRIT